MKLSLQINRKFNTLSLEEYIYFIDNYKKYTDFNMLGLYRSLLENSIINTTDKIEVREYAHKTFKKSFDFLQIKDPVTFLEVSSLGQELTKVDRAQLWYEIRENQQKILTDKKIKHRNFGQYSKHNCRDENCIWNGFMIKQESWLREWSMYFDSDKNPWPAKCKSICRKSDRKSKKQIIVRELENE